MKMKKYLFVIVMMLSFMTSAHGQTINVDDIQMGANTQKQVAVSLNNPGKDLSALQFDLVVPEGVSIAVDKATLNSSRIVDHELHVKQMGDNIYRFLVFSMTNADFVGASGDLVYVPLISSEDVQASFTAGSIEEQLVCASDGKPDYLANVSFDVLLTGSLNLAFGASGMLTYVSNFDLDFNNLENVNAYIATGYDIASNELWLTKVTDVPAGTPILVIGPADETIKVPAVTSSIYYPESFLKGSATETSEVFAETDDYQNWILNEDGKFGKVLEAMPLEAGKAYLSLPKTVVTGVASTGILPFTMLDNTKAYVGQYDLDFTNVEGLKAYTVIGFAKGGNVWLTQVKKASAGTPLYLVGEKGASYTVPSTMVQTAYVNMLKGSATHTTDLSTIDSGLSIYIVNDKFKYMSPDALFSIMMGSLMPGVVYMPVPTDYAINPSTNTGYSTIEEPAEVISIKLDDETTAISRVKASRKDAGIWYNLQGQRVENPRKGMYILDGKKKVLK